MNQDQHVIRLNLFNMKYFWLQNKSLSYKYILLRRPHYNTYTVKRIIRDMSSGNNDVVAALLKSSSFNAMFPTMKYLA